MYFVGNPLTSEQLVETNGTYGREWMPVVFWTRDTREFYVKTRVISEASHRRSLVEYFRKWEATPMKLKPKKP
jgi:hypothetical protein